MGLTWKCKDEFEHWFEPPLKDDVTGWERALHGHELAEFNSLPDNMKFGVYEDYFDSVGLRINITECGRLKYQVLFYQYDGDMSLIAKAFDTRQMARTSAITKANEIRNEQLIK
jgi:hypothetical protein